VERLGLLEVAAAEGDLTEAGQPEGDLMVIGAEDGLGELEGAAEVDLAAVEIAAPHQGAPEVVVDGRGVRVEATIREVGEVGERVADRRASGAAGFAVGDEHARARPWVSACGGPLGLRMR